MSLGSGSESIPLAGQQSQDATEASRRRRVARKIGSGREHEVTNKRDSSGKAVERTERPAAQVEETFTEAFEV